MNESKIALIFPGQGSQAVGMGKELAEKYPDGPRDFRRSRRRARLQTFRNCALKGPKTSFG